MITKLEIHNYESHKRTILTFPSPGLTVFIGESDRGKSGCFRAFNFARTNQPLGKGMLPLYWDGETSVKVHFDTGETIIRTKGQNANQYALQIPGQKDKSFNAGTKVPEEISAVFRMEEVNYQSQIDRAFLMFDNSGQRGRVLNKIVGLDSIDTTLSAAKRDVGYLKQEMGNQENITISLKEKLEKYEVLPEINELLTQSEQLSGMLVQISSVISGVTKIGSSFQKKKKDLEVYRDLDSIQTTILQVKESNASLEKTCSEIEIVTRIRNKLIEKNKKAGKEKLLDKVAEQHQLIVEKQKEFEKISSLCFNLNAIKAQIKFKKEKYYQLGKQIEIEKTRIPKNCPVCGGEVKI